MAVLERSKLDRHVISLQRTWEQFKLIRAGFENAPGVRLFYANQRVEIVMPGREHELFKSIIGLLIETFLIERDREFEPTGSMDQVKEEAAFVHADESYNFGKTKDIPDLSIEVTFSSGSAAKLERYQILGVSEVWFWEDGIFALYHLRENGYARVEQSELQEFMDLDMGLLTRCVLLGETSRLAAVRAFKLGLAQGHFD
jgi:Uma2 family endonuclease